MLAVVAVAVLLTPAGGPEAALRAGEDLYYEGRYSEAIAALERLLSSADTPHAVRVRALQRIAFSSFLLGDNRAARDTWLRLLVLEPAFELDPVEVSPEIVSFFGRIRPPSSAAATPTGSPSPPAPAPVPADGRGCGVLLCLAPFGVAQFANGKVGKGLLFAALEAGFLGANVLLYWNRVAEYQRYGGFRDPEAADRKYVWQHVSLGLFVVAVAVGIVDAYAFP